VERRPVLQRLVDGLGAWLVAGTVAWLGVAWLGWTLWHNDPPKAGFDLSLLLEGARRVLDGLSPYDPAMLAGTSPDATGLFYSYPPPVAQAMTLLAWLPDGVALVLWAIGATAGLGLVTWRIARASGRDGRRQAVRVVATVPLVLPFAVALLFGNLDAWYPLAYGALLLAVLPGAGTGTLVAGGVAAAAISIAKLHPAPLLLWVALRAFRERGGPQARVLAGAVVAGVAIVVVSLLVGGTGPWADYVQVVRIGADAELVDGRNLGPVSLIGLATGQDGTILRAIQAVIALAVAGVAVLAAYRVRDPLLGFGLVSAASLVTLPVTWYHYPVALLPLAIALAIRHPVSRPRVVLSVVVVDLAIAWPALVWLAVAILLVGALEASRRGRGRVAVALPA
jgi:Glycosyltransferase family 87